MSIETIFAHISCNDLEVSTRWYEKLFGKAPTRAPMPGLVEWHFTDSAEVQLFEDKKNAGHSTLTLECSPSSRARQVAKRRSKSGEIEPANHFLILRLRDPDANLVVLPAPGAPDPAQDASSKTIRTQYSYSLTEAGAKGLRFSLISCILKVSPMFDLVLTREIIAVFFPEH